MAKIIFPSSTAPGRDAIEGAGRLVNAYAERLQEGAPASYVLRRPPGLTAFCTTALSNYRGSWYDGGSYIYAAWGDELYYIDSAGTETLVGELLGARLTFVNSFTSAADLTVYTYAAVPVGTAHPERRIVVAVFYDVADDFPAASVTIGGVAATLVVDEILLTGADVGVGLYIANVPLLTTADVVVTYATAALRSAIGVWRLNGVTTDTPTAVTQGAVSGTPMLLNVLEGGAIIAVDGSTTVATTIWSGVTEDFDVSAEATKSLSGAHLSPAPSSGVVAITFTTGAVTQGIAASWPAASAAGGDIVTFAKNNRTPTPDQVLVTPSLGAFTFTTTTLTILDVNSEVPNSVCYGDGYFFFTTPEGRCYASGINTTTVNALDVIRAEAKPEQLVRGVFFDGELYLFGLTHTEVWGAGGNPNATGFPLNRTTVIWRGLVAPLAITGFEDGFQATLVWVADDDTVRMLDGYAPVQITTPDLHRAIEDCSDKSSIRAFCYDVEGHNSIVIDLAGEATWVYDLTTLTWHERDTADSGYWRAHGNSVKAFNKWIVGDHLTGNLYQIDKTALTDGGSAIPFIVESIAMESFPQRLRVDRADFNFVSGVGTASVPDPKITVSWSDSGGHRWTDPKTRKLGESGRFYEHIRINGCGLTGVKGRRWRLRVDDQVYIGLLGGSMEVSGR